MRILFPILIILFLLLGFSCKKKDADYSHSLRLKSKFSGHEYQVDILIKGVQGEQKVFYVLDGKELIPMISKHAEGLSQNNQLIFVALNYPRKNERTRDYTISEKEKGTGGAALLRDFIIHQADSELIAAGIADPLAERGIIGHSLGGLMASYCFCTANDFFSNFLIMSPALFYDNYRFFELEKDRRTHIKNSNAKVFLGVGRAEDLGMANNFEALKNIMESEYLSVQLKHGVYDGSHYNSREQIIQNGLQHLIK